MLEACDASILTILGTTKDNLTKGLNKNGDLLIDWNLKHFHKKCRTSDRMLSSRLKLRLLGNMQEQKDHPSCSAVPSAH